MLNHPPEQSWGTVLLPFSYVFSCVYTGDSC